MLPRTRLVVPLTERDHLCWLHGPSVQKSLFNNDDSAFQTPFLRTDVLSSQYSGSVESRLEGLEEVTNLIPEILERLGPQTLTPNHQRTLQKYVQQVHELSGKPYGTLYESLKTAFGVPRYADIADQDWPRVVQWFRAHLEP